MNKRKENLKSIFLYLFCPSPLYQEQMAFDPLQRTPGTFCFTFIRICLKYVLLYIGVNVEYYTYIFNLLILNLSSRWF